MFQSPSWNINTGETEAPNTEVGPWLYISRLPSTGILHYVTEHSPEVPDCWENSDSKNICGRNELRININIVYEIV